MFDNYIINLKHSRLNFYRAALNARRSSREKGVCLCVDRLSLFLTDFRS